MPYAFAHAGSPQRRAFLVVLGVLAVLGQTLPLQAQTAQSLRIVPLVRDDQVLVSFELTDGFTEEVRAAIRSGLKTTYTYIVDLRLAAPGWFDRTMATATLRISVEFNNLTRTFTLERRLDGRVMEANVTETEDENVVREWMTTQRRLPLFATSLLELNREYYVRVGATARPSSGSILWPFGSGTSAQAKFTYLR